MQIENQMGNWNNKILTNQQNIDPKEIFKAYCSEIGQYYSQFKFKYYKARPRIERQTNDIIECVTFWTSRTNEKNEYVHLEILPYIKSKTLKKWIKENKVGRNEFLYALRVDYPRNLGIYGHQPEDFNKLMFEMDSRIISKLEKARDDFEHIPGVLNTDEYDSSIIADNFISYLCMTKSAYLEQALNKYAHKLTEEFMSQIEKIKRAYN